MRSIIWRHIRWKVFLAIIVSLGVSRGYGQDMRVKLSADEAVAAAVANNRSVRIARLDVQAADARYKETEAVFLPQVGISYSAMTTDNPLDAFGFKLQQKTIQQADFNPALLNHPGGTPDFLTSFDAQQPLIDMDQLLQRKAVGTEKDVYRLKSERTRENVVFETRKAYMQLQLAYRAQEVMEEALRTAQALYNYTNDRVGQGMLSKADALNVQVQVKTTESRLAEAKTGVMDASDYLGLLMGRPRGLIYAVDSATDRNAAMDGPSIAMAGSPADTGSATTGAGAMLPEDRADLSAFRKGIEASELMIRSNKMSGVPRLNAFGSYQLNDSRMFGFGAGGYLAGIRLSWDIFKGNSIRNKNATLQVQKNKLAEQYAQYKEQSAVELDATLRKLGDAQFAIGRQQVAVASALESSRILRDRYEQGLAGSTDILLAQSQVAQQRLALARAVFDRDVARAYIDLLTTRTTDPLAPGGKVNSSAK